MKRRIDRHNVTDFEHVLDIGMPSDAQLLLDRFGEPMSVIIVKMHVEGLRAAEHGEADTAGGDSADMHALDIIRPFDAVGEKSCKNTTRHQGKLDDLSDYAGGNPCRARSSISSSS